MNELGPADKAHKTLRNLRSMVSQGASDPEVSLYLEGAGVPGEHLRLADQESRRSPQPEPGVGASFGRGMVDIYQGAKQLTGAMSPEQEQAALAERQLYEQGAAPGFDAPRMLGQVAGTAPLGGMAALGAKGAGIGAMALRGGAGALTGAASGALVLSESDEERLQNALAGFVGGGVGGAVLPPLVAAGGRMAGRGVNALRGAVDSLNPAAQTARVGSAIDEAGSRIGVRADEIAEGMRGSLADDTAAALRNPGDLAPEAVLRGADIESAGFTGPAAPTRGQITRDARQFSSEQNLAKLDDVGAPIQQKLVTQEQTARDLLDQFGQRSGGADFAQRGPQQVGELVEGAAQAQDRELGEAVTQAYNAVRDATGNAPLPIEGFIARATPTLEDAAGVLPANLHKMIANLAEGRVPFTPEVAIRLDKALTRARANPAAPNAGTINWAVGKLQRELLGVLDDASAKAGDDLAPLYREAKAAASARFEARGPMNRVTGQLVAGDGRVDTVINQVMSGDPRQVSRLMNFVTPQGDEAVEAIRGAVVSRLIERSTPSGNFSQAGFNRALQGIGPERLSILFGPDGARDLQQFGRAAEALFAQPAFHNINTSNTASAGANLLMKLWGMFRGVRRLVPGNQALEGLGEAARFGNARLAQSAQVDDALRTSPLPPPVRDVFEPRRFKGATRALPGPVAGAYSAEVSAGRRRRP